MKKSQFIAILFASAGLLLALMWVMGGIGGTAVHAASFTVNSTIDAVDANPGDGSCATSSGDCTLRAAIQEANALPGLDNINLPNGTYQLSLTGAAPDTDAFGDLDITDDLFLSGMIAQTTVIDAQQIDRIFAIPSGVNATLAAITIQNGLAEYGSGISNMGSLTMIDAIIQNNDAVHTGYIWGGGGIYTGGAVTLTNTLIDSNTTTGEGGGIFQSGTLTLINSTISNNTSSIDGGGLVIKAGDVTLQNSHITDNLSNGNYGGGIHHSGGLLTMTGGTVQNNTSNYMGGGIYLADNSQVSMIDNIVFANNVSQWGGALYITNNNAQIAITNAEFNNNMATSGGGAIYYGYADNTTLTIANSTFSGNYLPVSASSGGGALRMNGSFMTLNVSDSLIEQNISPIFSGGGIAISSSADNATVAISNTAFISNTGYSGGGLISSGDFVEMSIHDSQFIGNEANGGSGGAVYITTGQDSSIAVAGTVFDNNSATSNGGAFTNVATTATITGTAFTNNHGLNGGAVAVLGNLDVNNSTFSGNRADESGGGLYANSMTDVIALNNATIAYNVADDDNNGSGNGGGFALDNGASLSVGNSIIANNVDKGSESPDCANPNTHVSNGYNLVGQADGCNWPTATGDLVGTAVSPIDPILEPLTGSPAAHSLGFDSPAIDAGSPGPANGMPPNCEALDQYGTARPVDGDGDNTAVCDMGAVEASAQVIIVVDPALAATLTYTDTQDNPTIITIPAGAVTDTTTLIFSPVTAVTPPTNLTFANHAFTLNAYRNDNLLPNFTFEQPITTTIHYSTSDVIGIGEDTLSLLYWDGSAWADDGITVIEGDADNNVITVTTTHLSQFALFGEGYTVYLPAILR